MNLSEHIQQSTGYNSATVNNVIDAFTKAIAIAIRTGEEIKIEKFGIFSFKNLPERPGRNPRTGEEITLAAKLRPSFKFSRNFVDSVQPDKAATEAPTPSSVNNEKLPPPMPEDLLEPAVNKSWYMSIGGTETKEIPQSQLIANGLTPKTPLWSQETGWKLASDIPELAYLFS